MKTITIAGRTTRDAELRHTQSGDAVLSFSVAVDDRSTKEKTTLFFDCSIWGKRAAALQPHIVKGTALTASGDLGKREHEGKTYLTVRVNDVALQGGVAEKRSTPKAEEKRTSYDDDPRTTSRALDDDLPF